MTVTQKLRSMPGRPAFPAARLLPLVVVASLAATGVSAQMPTQFRDEFLSHFERSSAKIRQLAQVVPEDLYTWSPGEGVMEIGHVYMHIARYNFMYLEDNLGIPAPEDLDLATLEEIRGKGDVVAILERSVEHVREHVSAMSAEKLTAETALYGRRVAGWAVLFQLLAHMNEHVGQSVSYARMNGIIPPWSR